MEGIIAKWYAGLTKKSMKDFKALAQNTAMKIPAHSRILDLAPGPGYFAIELAKLGEYEVTGLDISQTFVEIARANAMASKVKVDFRWGSASAMPFTAETFDFLLCRAAFKNFSEPKRALEEIYRVLRPGAEALIIDLRRDASIQSISEAVHKMHLGLMNTMLTQMTFRFMLLKRAYTRAEFENLIADSPFGNAQIKESLIGLEISLFKNS